MKTVMGETVRVGVQMCPVPPQASPEPMSSKDSPSPRKSLGSPKHKGAKGPGSGKKEKKAAVSSPLLESARYRLMILIIE